MRPSHLLLGLLLASPALAQLKPGTHLVCAAGALNNRGIFVVDRYANTSTQMAIVGIPWSTTAPVRTFVEDSKNFLVAVRQGLGYVYRVTWNGTTWNAKRLNTTGVGPIIWAVTRIGGFIYMTTSSGGNTASNGTVWKLAANGGAPALYQKIGPTYWGMPTAMTAVGSKLHVFLWDAPSATRPKHLTIDTAATTPKITPLGKWPREKARSCSSLPVLPTQAHYDPHTKLLVIGGRLGNILKRTVSGVTVRHDTLIAMACNPPRTTWGQSLGFNSDTGAILYGSASRNIDEQLCQGGTWKRNVTPISFSSTTPINGIEYVSSGSLYRLNAVGCAQSNGQVPCNFVTSLPMPGNAKFGFGVETTSKAGLLILGAKPVSLKLDAFGAPGCTLGVSPVLILIPQLATGGLVVPVPLPSSLKKGAPIYTQWVLLANVNKLGLIVSDVRRMVP